MLKNSLTAIACVGILGVQQAYALDPRPGVKVRALEKVTGKATDIEIELDDTVQFGGLGFTVRACHQSPPEEQPPESAAYLEVISMGVNAETGTAKDDDPRLFSGWMFASSPGLNALEHSLYDVWVISCSAALPGSETAPLELYDEAGLGLDGNTSSVSAEAISSEVSDGSSEDGGTELSLDNAEPIFIEEADVDASPPSETPNSSFIDSIVIPAPDAEYEADEDASSDVIPEEEPSLELRNRSE